MTSPANSQLSLSDFLTEMQKGSATSNWDVVVSYSTDALNSILSKTELGNDNTVTVQVNGIPYLTNLLTQQGEETIFADSGVLNIYSYTLVLEPPQLQFVTSTKVNACDITMDMTSDSVEQTKQWQLVSVDNLTTALEKLISETHLPIFATELSNLKNDADISSGAPYFSIETSGDYLSFTQTIIESGKAATSTRYYKKTSTKPSQSLLNIVEGFSVSSDYKAAEFDGTYYDLLDTDPKLNSWTEQYSISFATGALKLYQYALLGYQGKTETYVQGGLYTASSDQYLKQVQPGSITFFSKASESDVPSGLTWTDTYWGKTAIDQTTFSTYAQYNKDYYISGNDPEPAKTLFPWIYVADAPGPKALTGGNVKTANISTEVGLASITGELSSDATVDGSNSISFGTNTTSAHIVLDFQTTSSFNAEIDGSFTPSEKTLIDQNIEFFFRQSIRAIDYPLNGFNNSTKSNVINLEPERILFASDPGSQSLSLFIETSLGGNVGSSVPSVSPGGNAINPIPENADVTIIFSNSLIGNSYFGQQLAGSFSSTLNTDPSPGKLQLQLVPNDSDVSIKMPSSHVKGVVIGHLSIDDLKIDYNKTPLNMSVDNDQLSLDWSYSYGCKWSGSTIVIGSKPIFDSGTFTVHLNLTNNQTLSVKNNEIEPISTTVSPSFSISGDVPASSYRNSSQVRSDVESNVNKSLPAFEIQFDGLNFFNTANVLIPSGSALDYAAPKDNSLKATSPIFTPFDMVMTANIVASKS